MLRSPARRITFGGFGWNQPTISAGGVVNDANFQAPIAPGSYVAIFGTGLSGFSDPAVSPFRCRSPSMA